MIFRRRRARQQRAEDAAAIEQDTADALDSEGSDSEAPADADEVDEPAEVDAEVDVDVDVDDADDTDEVDDTEDVEDDAVDDSADEDADEDAEDEEDDEADRGGGPWDVSEEFPDAERLDLGAIRVPVVDGFEIQVRMEDDEVVAATVLHGESGLEIMACAAPRSTGLWDELRSEMIKGLKGSGGKVAAIDGEFGRELVAEVPVAGADGRQGTQHIRFVGVDGPRWFLRGAFSGRAVDEPKQAKPLEEILRNTVVNRGKQAMAPRELIPLELPREAREALGLTAQKDEAPQTNRFKSVRRAPGTPG